MSTTHHYGITMDPAMFEESDDGTSNPPKRPTTNQVLKVRNSLDQTACPDQVVAARTGWVQPFSLTDVPMIDVSTDNGTTWIGPFLSAETRKSAGTAADQLAAAVSAAGAAAVSASDATTAANNAQDAADAAAASAAAAAEGGTGPLKSYLTIANPGEVQTGQQIAGNGFRVPYQMLITGMIAYLDHEPRGAGLVVELITRDRASGTDTSRGTATITSNTGKRAALDLSATPVTLQPGDRIFAQVNQVGSTLSGGDITIEILGPGATIPSALAAPAAPTGFSAGASGSDVALAWTASASGVRTGYDIYRDGVFYARAAKNATSFTDVAAAADGHSYAIEAFNDDAVSAQATASFVPSSGITDLGLIATFQHRETNGNLVFTVTQPVPVGSTVLLAVAASGSSGSFSATDSRGNSYVVDGTSVITGGSEQCAGLRANIASGKALQVGDTITLTCPTGISTPRFVASVRAVSGLLTSSGVLDQTASNQDSASNKPISSGTTGTLAQANEYLFAIWSVLAQTGTVIAGGSFALGEVASTTAGTNDRSVITMWQIVAATTAIAATGTLNNSSPEAGLILAYKGA